MSQTNKTTQTKKKGTPAAATKQSTSKKSVAAKVPQTAPLTTPEPEVVAATATEGDLHEMPLEALPDAPTSPSDTNAEAIAYDAEMDSHVEPTAETAMEQEEIEAPLSTTLVDEATTPSEPENITTADAATENAVDAEPIVQSDVTGEIVPATNSAENSINLVPVKEVEVDSEVGVNPPEKRAKGIEDRQLRSVSPRYAAACAEVGRLRKGFLYALNRKAAILGVERVGEAVPVKNSDIDAIDIEIREARQKLEDLMARKKQLKGASPELDDVNQTIRELSRQRQVARVEKKAAFDEAMATEISRDGEGK